jgi:hypothetical protein
MRDLLVPILVGAAGGAIVGSLVFWYASRTLDQQLASGAQRLSAGLTTGQATLQQRLAEGERQLEARIRTEVARAIDTQLGAYGVTPERMRRVIAGAERVGILGISN